MSTPMDSSINIEELQRKADALLQNLLSQSTGKPPPEVARSITNLAFEESNAVRDLFLIAPTAPPIPTPSSHSLKSRASNRFLRLARREHRSPTAEGKTPTPAYQIASTGSAQAYGEGRPGTNASSLRSSDKPGNDTGSVLYNCILCSDDMSSKGVCKRHLEEQHVLPKTFKCERCGETFTTKGDAKKHCNRCGLGVFTYAIVKPQSKKIYASEFTEEWFASKQSYLEHLLKLSRKDSTRLTASPHCKLRALLGHPSLLPHVDAASKRIFRSSTAWRSMRLSEEQLHAAITHLEDAAILQENGSIDFGGVVASTKKPFDARSFLEDLFSNSTISVSSISQPMPFDAVTALPTIPDRHSSIVTVASQPTMSPMAETVTSPQSQMDPSPLEQLNISPEFGSGDSASESAPVPPEVKMKRHLSDESRFFQPPRAPPGPSTGPVHFHNPFGATQPNMPELQMPDLANPNLPYRASEDSVSLYSNAHNSMSHMQFHPPLVLPGDLPSAAASSTTLVSSQQEPKLFESPSIAYDIWNHAQEMGYIANFNQPSTDNISYISYQPSDDASMRAPSIAPEQVVMNAEGDGTKLPNFLPLTAYPAAGPYESFLPGGHHQQQQFHDMTQPPS